MFEFDCFRYDIINSVLEETYVNKEEVDIEILHLLADFENKVFNELSSLPDFKYIQGAIGGNRIFNQAKSRQELKDTESFLFSTHPKYIGTDLITTYLESFLKNRTYCVFFTGQWRDSWLNSRISKEHLLEMVSKVSDLTNLSNLCFYTLEIYASNVFDVEQINTGITTPRWKVIEKRS